MPLTTPHNGVVRQQSTLESQENLDDDDKNRRARRGQTDLIGQMSKDGAS
jgi:hypothetical protein